MLPTCPACKQSVLDDDAVDCPFCGANMKTGKGAKPKSAAPAKSAPKAVEPAPSKPAASKSKPARSAATFDDDDDPFSQPEDDPFTEAAKEEAANKAKAIPVMPRKGKLNNTEIKCPMCETVGFVPEAAAGKDVKCCNPKCTMPVFMAPKRFAAPIPAAAPAKVKQAGNSKMPLILTLLGGVCLVGIVGAGFYFWPDGGKEVDKKPWETDPDFKPGVTPKIAEQKPNDPSDTDNKNQQVSEAAVPKGPDIPELLGFMHLLSSEEEILQNKLKCRRLVAVGNAAVNNAPGMTEQFEMLDKLEPKQAVMKIPAILAFAWGQLESGDKAGTLKSVEQAIALLGAVNRETQEPVLDMVSMLVALGKLKEAQQLLASKLPDDQNTPLSVMIAVARSHKDFDLTRELPGATPIAKRPWPELGVTLILAARGMWNESLQWAEAVPDVESKTGCLLGWADAKTRVALASKSAVDPAVEGVGAKFTHAAKVQLLARLALTNANAGNKNEAERLVKAALAVLKTIPVPPAARCDGFKEALDWKQPDLLPLRQAMLGAAQLGQAQGRLNQVEAGWNTTLEALKLGRAMAPSPAAVAAVQRSADQLGTTGLRDKIRQLLKLRAADEAIKKASDLLENLRNLKTESEARYQLQETILIGAAHSGMAALVWKEVLSLSQRTDQNELEPFLTGLLAHHLRSQLAKEDKKEELALLEAKLEGVELPVDEVRKLQTQVDESLTAAKFNDIINFANQNKLVPGAEAVILKSFIEAVKKPELGVNTLSFVAALDLKSNPQLNMIKLEGLRITSAFASRQGKATEVKDLLQRQILTPLEKIAGFVGLIEGNAIWHREHPAPTPVPAPADGTAKPEV